MFWIYVLVSLVSATVCARSLGLTRRLRLPRGRAVLLRSGTRWYPLWPRFAEVNFADWTALAYLRRFGGHADEGSVAEHLYRTAFLVRRRGGSPWAQLMAALHDVEEAYPPGDIAGPVMASWSPLVWGMRWMRWMAWRAIARRLHMSTRLPEVVLWADRKALDTEAYWRMPEGVFSIPRGKGAPSSQPERWGAEYAAWRWWTLVGELAARCAADTREAWVQASVQGAREAKRLWERCAALTELEVVARREADRFDLFKAPKRAA